MSRVDARREDCIDRIIVRRLSQNAPRERRRGGLPGLPDATRFPLRAAKSLGLDRFVCVHCVPNVGS